jgi:hypothetical protein
MKNIIVDEYKTVNIERLIGYNKMQIRKFLSLKAITLNVLSLSIATITSVIVNFLINYYLNFKLVIFDFNLLLKIYSIILFVTLLFCLFYEVKKSKNLRVTN